MNVRENYRASLLGLEHAIQEGVITHNSRDATPRYIIIGYESGVAQAYSIKADVDWHHEVLRPPVITRLFPVGHERFDSGLRIMGQKSALEDLCDPFSPAYQQTLRRFQSLHQFCSGHPLSLGEARSLILALLSVQAERDSPAVTAPFRLITIKRIKPTPADEQNRTACANHDRDWGELQDGISDKRARGRRMPTIPTVISDTPTMAPHGQGPLGGRSRLTFGIQPVEPTRKKGNANVLAIETPELRHSFRNRVVRTDSIPFSMEGSYA